MVQQVLNLGNNANDGTGDDLRSAMTKVDANFTELSLKKSLSLVFKYFFNFVLSLIIFKPIK